MAMVRGYTLLGWSPGSSPPMPLRPAFVAMLLLAVHRIDAFGEAQKYLLATSPVAATVAYLKLPSDGSPANGEQGAMRVLIDAGLSSPQGIAVDEYRQYLYVADPGLSKLVRYPLKMEQDMLQVNIQKREDVATPVETRAVAVDGVGDVWFTDESKQQILRVTAANIERKNITPQVMYDGASLDTVRSPGGLALDNYFVYWLNKAEGEIAGTVLRADQNPKHAAAANGGNITLDPGEAHSAVKILTSNAAKCYGVCLGFRNIFYTGESQHLYAVPRAATFREEAVKLSSSFSEPRGCVFDGDSTVYVADKATNEIYGFASNYQHLPNNVEVPLTKAANLQGAFGLAMYTVLTE